MPLPALPKVASRPWLTTVKVGVWANSVAAEKGFVDEVILPRTTRRRLIQALATLETKRDKNPPKKHGNIPL